MKLIFSTYFHSPSVNPILKCIHTFGQYKSPFGCSQHLFHIRILKRQFDTNFQVNYIKPSVHRYNSFGVGIIISKLFHIHMCIWVLSWAECYDIVWKSVLTKLSKNCPYPKKEFADSKTMKYIKMEWLCWKTLSEPSCDLFMMTPL